MTDGLQKTKIDAYEDGFRLIGENVNDPRIIKHSDYPDRDYLVESQVIPVLNKMEGTSYEDVFTLHGIHIKQKHNDRPPENEVYSQDEAIKRTKRMVKDEDMDLVFGEHGDAALYSYEDTYVTVVFKPGEQLIGFFNKSVRDKMFNRYFKPEF